MKIYKLKYSTKEDSIKDLESRNILEDRNILGIAHVGKLIKTNAVLNEEGEVLEQTIWLDGYHIDIACKEDLYTFENEIFPINSEHKFA
tara:strand:+ start:165 stop:431 length:267 start_codon:yes stop_codon:yes gene_type:complete